MRGSAMEGGRDGQNGWDGTRRAGGGWGGMGKVYVQSKSVGGGDGDGNMMMVDEGLGGTRVWVWGTRQSTEREGGRQWLTACFCWVRGAHPMLQQQQQQQLSSISGSWPVCALQ